MARFKFVYSFNSSTPVSVYFDNLIVEGTHQLNENTCAFETLPITLKYKKATGFANGNLMEFEVETTENSDYIEIYRQFVGQGSEYVEDHWELACALECRTIGYYAYFDEFPGY